MTTVIDRGGSSRSASPVNLRRLLAAREVADRDDPGCLVGGARGEKNASDFADPLRVTFKRLQQRLSHEFRSVLQVFESHFGDSKALRHTVVTSCNEGHASCGELCIGEIDVHSRALTEANSMPQHKVIDAPMREARQSTGAAVPASETTTPESRNSQHVLKAEAARPDATDRENPGMASPDGGPMGVGQPAAADPIGVPPIDEPLTYVEWKRRYAERLMHHGWNERAAIKEAEYVWASLEDADCVPSPGRMADDATEKSKATRGESPTLSDDEIRTLWMDYDLGGHAAPMLFARALEARIRGVQEVPRG